MLLALIINACLKLSYFPEKWKHAKVIAIKKPNKPGSLPSSHRPISLLSSLSKVLERVVLIRLTKHLKNNNILPPEQHGFREKLSTVTQLQRIKSHIQGGFNVRKSTGMILIDIEKAYERIWHNGLLFKLIVTKTPHYIIKFIHSYLRNRTFQVNVNNNASTTKHITYGLPQCAVLSPTLYNVYIHDFPRTQDCKIAFFADDTAFFATSRLSRTIIKNLENAVKKFSKYYQKWKIKINEDKTQAIFFTKRRTRQLPHRNFIIGDRNIEWENSAMKYLGVYLDKRLTFKHHVDYVIKKTNTAVRILYSLMNRKSKLNINSKILLFKTMLRPIMTYATPIINTIAKSHKKLLQTTQNKIIKMIIDAPLRTSTSQMHEETEFEMVEDYMNEITERFENRQ